MSFANKLFATNELSDKKINSEASELF